MSTGLGPRRVRQAIVVGVVLGSTVLGGVVQAASVMHIPGADGIIHACFEDESGKLRLIDSLVGQCKRDETSLHWNQTGPQGSKGDTGAQGAQGLQGDMGPQGAKGDAGPQGAQGPAGAPGAQGPSGATGSQGPAGAPGISGYQQVNESVNGFSLAASAESVHVLTCPAGKKVLGGGFLSFGANGLLSNNSNGPVNDTQWGVSVYNPSTSNTVSVSTISFYAVCAIAAS